MNPNRRKMLLGASGVAGALLAASSSVEASDTTISADEVGFLPVGGNARTVEDKLRDTVSIKDFGAVMDGVTDDYNAIAAALAAVASTGASQARRLIVPGRGTAYCSKTLTVREGVELVGEGGILKFAVGVNAVNLLDGAILSDLTIDGSSLNVAEDDTPGRGASGVLLLGDNCTVRNVTAKNFGYHGFASATGGADRCVLMSCHAFNCGHRGINLSEGSSYNRVVNFEARNCMRAGIILGYHSSFNVFQNIYIEGHSTSKGGAGLWVHMNSNNNLFDDIVIGPPDSTGQTAPSLLLGAGCNGNSFSRIKIFGAGTRGILLWNHDVDHIEDLGTYNTSLAGNRFSDISIMGTGQASSNGILMNVDNGRPIENNFFDRVYIDGFDVGVRDLDDLTSGIEFSNFRFGNGIADRRMRVGNATNYYRTSRRTNCAGLTGVGSLALALHEYDEQPEVPATNMAVTQPYPFQVMIFISGLTGATGVKIDGTNVNSMLHDSGNGTYILLPQQTITLTYSSGTPSWRWFGL